MFFLFLNPHLSTCLLIFRERARKKHQCEREILMCCLLCTPTSDGTHNLGMCPDREFNLQHFGVRGHTPNELFSQGSILFADWLHKSSFLKLSFEPGTILLISSCIICFKDFIYLFLERGRQRERGREISMCDCLSRVPHWEPGPQPRHVPWLGIKSATLWFAGRHSIHWATPAWTHELFWYIIALCLHESCF